MALNHINKELCWALLTAGLWQNTGADGFKFLGVVDV